MAKVVLVQYLVTDHLGVLCMSSVLKNNGHESTVLIRHEEKRIVEKVKELKADIVGFSCTTGVHLHALKDAKSIKKSIPGIITIMGGPHATFSPEVIYADCLDMVCRGEGENALLQLADHLDRKTDYSCVSNLWVKKDENIFKNEVAPLIENIDELPFADRSHYLRYPVLRNKEERAIMFGRGCPYDCTFCFNSSLRDMYKGKGRYIRRRSIDNVIRELKELKSKYFVKQISFEDDTFLDDKDWILKFLKEYRTHIGLPYRCHTRFDTINDDTAAMLKSSKCYLVALGLESGSEKRREQILKKRLKTQDILTGADILHRHGLRFLAYNIIGSPNETTDEAIDTLMLNRKIKPDFPFSSLFQPYPGTAIVREYNIGGNLEQIPPSFWSRSVIKQDNIRELENLHRLFYIFLMIPVRRETIKLILGLDIFRYLYDLLFKVGLFYYAAKPNYSSKSKNVLLEWNIVSFVRGICIGWRERNMY